MLVKYTVSEFLSAKGSFSSIDFGPKMIVDSCDSRREPARSPHDAHKIVRTSNDHPVVTPRRWHNDREGALRRDNNFQTGIDWLSLYSCLFHFNTCLQGMSLIPPLRVTQYGPSSVC